MAAKGNGSSQYSRTGTLTYPTTYTYAFFYKASAAPNTTDTKIPFGMVSDEVGAYNGDVHTCFIWSFPDSTVYKAAIHRVGGGADYRCQISGTPANGVWIHIAVVFNGTQLKVYLNGALNNTVSATTNAPPTHSPRLTVLSYDGTVGYDDSYIAQLTVWNTVLTDAQIAELGAGIDPTTIANANIVSNFPMNADSDETVGPNFVDTGATFNATYFVGSTGGPALGGATPDITTVYTWEPTGGIALGGNMQTTITVTTSGGIGLGGDMQSPATYIWEATGGMAFGGNMLSPAIYTITATGGIAIGGDGLDVFVQLGNGSFVMQEGRGEAETGER